ncbi:hypothetical protein NL676_035179 [Syzygium grande]|nr:hypothetical protein NL676_035179 [Syzygium grande]
MSALSFPLPGCLRRSTAAADDDDDDDPRSTAAGKTNLTTSLYRTPLGVFSLTWSRTRVGRTLQLRLSDPPASASDGGDRIPSCNSHAASPPSSPAAAQPSSAPLSFDLRVKPFAFWNKRGSKNLGGARVFWDLSRAKFGAAGPGPVSGYYVSVVVGGEAVLLVGDRAKDARARTKARGPDRRAQALVLRRDHVVGRRAFATAARFGGKDREISIDCTTNADARLCFEVDGKRVLQVKRLKWKFRGCERVEVDGVPIQVSWDVYNWLFEGFRYGHAVFMFRFDKLGLEELEQEEEPGGSRGGRAKRGRPLAVAAAAVELRDERAGAPEDEEEHVAGGGEKLLVVGDVHLGVLVVGRLRQEQFGDGVGGGGRERDGGSGGVLADGLCLEEMKDDGIQSNVLCVTLKCSLLILIPRSVVFSSLVYRHDRPGQFSES